jgi:hypothetical protein
MIHTDEPIPTVREELERKTVELLESLLTKLDQKRLDQLDVRQVAGALWTVTSGLVGKDVSDLCSQAAGMGAIRINRHTYIGKGKAIQIVWLSEKNGYWISKTDTVTLESKTTRVETEIGFREDEMKNLFGALTRSGYKRISI